MIRQKLTKNWKKQQRFDREEDPAVYRGKKKRLIKSKINFEEAK